MGLLDFLKKNKPAVGTAPVPELPAAAKNGAGAEKTEGPVAPEPAIAPNAPAQPPGGPSATDALQFWEAQVRQAALSRQPPLAEAPREITALAIDGPVWLPADAPSRTLFAAATPRQPKLLFLAASVSYAEQPAALQSMLPDAPGRLSRALPLFLGESAFLHMGLATNAIVPWLEGHGFAVMGSQWSDADAAAYARNAGAAAAVVLHIEQAADAGEVQLRLVLAQPSAAGAPATRMSAPVDWSNTGGAALLLWSRLANALLPILAAFAADAGRAQPVDAARYGIPSGPALSNYLLRLEQLLAVRCTGTAAAQGGFLSGEREIVRGQLDLALSMPGSLPLRLILHETLLRLRELRPDVVAEVHRPVHLLQQRYPLADPEANTILERQLRTIYGAGSISLPAATA